MAITLFAVILPSLKRNFQANAKQGLLSMFRPLLKFAITLPLLMAALLSTLSAQAASLEAELSKVTLFVEGMMKSRGGVT
ncbi:MAG: hypothetical protein COC19_07990 [SAR86 cluster bacterium]|uniref:Uncharacterized protein n=1 Tax=SAR86 cluster bacterium TaxID=2030880 RepID=A0A2A4MH73_9GAMM|nr:MAG: hypothetical protein COC19_07990 [SAR86 cluster bacterium]